jgi:hypothetical protein
LVATVTSPSSRDARCDLRPGGEPLRRHVRAEANRGVGHQPLDPLRGPLGDHAAAIQHDHAARHAVDLGEVVGAEEDRLAEGGEAVDLLPEGAPGATSSPTVGSSRNSRSGSPAMASAK